MTEFQRAMIVAYYWWPGTSMAEGAIAWMKYVREANHDD